MSNWLGSLNIVELLKKCAMEKHAKILMDLKLETFMRCFYFGLPDSRWAVSETSC